MQLSSWPVKRVDKSLNSLRQSKNRKIFFSTELKERRGLLDMGDVGHGGHCLFPCFLAIWSPSMHFLEACQALEALLSEFNSGCCIYIVFPCLVRRG